MRHRDIIFGLLAAAGDVGVDRRLGRVALHDIVVPVETLVTLLLADAPLFQFFGRNGRSPALVHEALGLGEHPLVGVRAPREACPILPAVIHIDIDARRSVLLAPLGGHQHDAVTGPQTVNSRRGILQHRDGLDVVRSQLVESPLVLRNAVDDEERVGPEVAHLDRRAGPGTSVGLTEREARQFSGEHGAGRRAVHAVEVAVADRRHGPGDRGAFLGAVTHDHHVVEHIGHLGKDRIDGGPGPDLLGHGIISQVGKLEGVAAAHAEKHIPTVGIGHRTLLSAFYNHGSSDHGVALFIDNRTGHAFPVLRGRGLPLCGLHTDRRQQEHAPQTDFSKTGFHKHSFDLSWFSVRTRIGLCDFGCLSRQAFFTWFPLFDCFTMLCCAEYKSNIHHNIQLRNGKIQNVGTA